MKTSISCFNIKESSKNIIKSLQLRHREVWMKQITGAQCLFEEAHITEVGHLQYNDVVCPSLS